MERRLPWLHDFFVGVDFERWERSVGRAADRVDEAIGQAMAPVADAAAQAGAAVAGAWHAFTGQVGRAASVLPVPEAARSWIGSPVVGHGSTEIADSAQATLKSRYDSMLWIGVIAAVGIHAAVFAFSPSMQAEDFSFAADELVAIEVPPEVTIPPPPEAIARPAVPVMSTNASIDEDITIAPTTFDENPVEDLPPPPDVDAVSRSDAQPTFTPYTVAPRILNPDEAAQVLRAEYPAVLRDAGIGGEVVVWLYIDEAGEMVEARLFQSSGYDQLDEAALRVADQLRFSGALDGDRRVPVWIQFPLTFRVR